MSFHAFGIGVGTKNKRGQWLEVYFPEAIVAASPDVVTRAAEILGANAGRSVVDVDSASAKKLAPLGSPFGELVESKRPIVAVFLKNNEPPESVPEAYLKLHLLSYRRVRPNGTNLTGIFKLLPNVAWTNKGPIDVDELAAAQHAARLQGFPIEIRSIDKFPVLVDYVIPQGVRIADTARVRLGAYLGPGTTVMHEGFLNFNAGTEGPNMVEGRISAGVFVGAGSDIGGGASTMGTLSGGNDVVISVGKSCLLGANAGLGIPLGDDCTVEAGLYLTAASKIRVLDKLGKAVRVMKAKELAHRSNLLFRRNSQDGAIECLPNKSHIALNDDLHSHN